MIVFNQTYPGGASAPRWGETLVGGVVGIWIFRTVVATTASNFGEVAPYTATVLHAPLSAVGKVASARSTGQRGEKVSAG